MKHISNGRSNKQNSLKILLSKEQTFDDGIKLLLEMHGLLHDKKVYADNVETFYNNLWENLNEETYNIISNKETSILWNIWHITRIEDIVTNDIIGNKDEILNNEIQTKLGIKTKDTGNAMNYKEIESLNKNINIKSLKDYRIKVGKQTQKIIKGLEYSDMKRKVEKKQLEKIVEKGGILEHEKSKWLLDFWGRKNILGLIMMPITRHQTVHLNDCFNIKEKYRL
jgi:transcriptional regulator NrdR family protein